MVTIQQIDEMIDNPLGVKNLLLVNGYSPARAIHFRRVLERLRLNREIIRRDAVEDVNFGE